MKDKSGRYAVAHLVDGDAGSSWCEGDSGAGVGARIDARFASPVRLTHMGLLPGIVKADWLFEANPRPVAVTITWEHADGQRTSTSATLKLPASVDLFQEGQRLAFLAAPAKPVVAVTLVVTRVGAGLFTSDLCLSELVFFEQPSPTP